ncbi:MAG: NAD-dependent DNA ligase LigA, partial [Crocinitomicaceae bacterium]|nr:NAD-dependent DNA ligase LigA [Crocinitomicaceae bacterium]
LDLHVGDYVYVEKGGEIIPKIVGVNIDKRDDSSAKVVFLENCPECQTALIRREGEAQHYCPNEKTCPPQVKGRIEHFISRKAMNIDGLGSETVDLLVEKGLIHNIADLYDLTFEQILNLDRMAEKSADNMIKGIELSKEVPFERVLFGVGIRFVGETVAKKLAKHFKNIDNIKNALYDQLIEADEIGEKIAISIQQFFLEEENVQLIERLKAKGLRFEMEEKVSLSSVLEGKTVVISGTFETFSRDELKELIERNGGKNGSSISSKTDYLVAGANMGPAKLKQATSLGITMLSEEEFIKMINS